MTPDKLVETVGLALAVERFASRINLNGSGGCWLWIGSVNKAGYGGVWAGKSRTQLAHRFFYEEARGKIPNGLAIDHICRVRNCVNPDHLRVVTSAENTLCGIGVTAVNARKTHCHKGHPLAGDNLYVDKKGGRTCRTCQRVSNYANKARSRALRRSTLDAEGRRVAALLARVLGPSGHFEIRGTGRGYRVWVPLKSDRLIADVKGE